jgi:hypothetical protein
VISDSIDGGENHFWTGEVDDDIMTAAVSITGGKYVIKAKSMQPMSWILLAEMPDLWIFCLRRVDEEKRAGIGRLRADLSESKRV